MRRNKPGLADLKQLRRKAEAAAQPPPPGRSNRAAARETVSKQGRTLTESDRKLFRIAMRHVEKLQDPGRVLLAPVPAAAPSQLKERRMRAAGLEPLTGLRHLPDTDTGQATARPATPRTLSDTYAPATSHNDDSRYLKAGHGTDVLKNLKRGRWTIGASLDLHGSTLEDARERFERFLASCLAHEIKCVRIVHGKGYGSKNGDAILKTTVRRWLTQLDEVIAYTECTEADGGSGAVQVLLR